MISGYRCALLFAIAVFLISGCASQGAKRLPADRFDYNAAIGSSAKEQMLLNIVRSRYQDMPVFLEVSSVVAQYAYDRSASVGYFREFINNSIAPTSDTASVNANVAFSELPTISYTPLRGEAFAKHLYSEIPPEIFLGAAHSGFAIDVLMQIGVQRIGTVENMSFAEVPIEGQRAIDLKNLERFFRAIELLAILSDSEVAEVQQVTGDKKAGTTNKYYLVISDKVPEPMRPLLAELRQLIGLANGRRFMITERTTDLAQDEVTIQTRSVMAMIKFISRGVEIPVEHLEQGWVVDFGLQNSEAELPEGLFPFRMRSSRNRPNNVFAAIRYQDYWFYIEHQDLVSKRTLESLMIMFQLGAPSTKSHAPLLTLPTR
jgi:hypothetical protein